MSVYKEAGVDIDAGDVLSKTAGELIKKTRQSSQYLDFPTFTLQAPITFRSPVLFRMKEAFYKAGCFEQLGSDGVGTKVTLTKAAGTWAVSARDLVTMLADDSARFGGIPVAMTNVLDLSSTADEETVEKLYRGLAETGLAEHIAIVSGETAELPEHVTSEIPEGFSYLWSGAILSLFHPDLYITGERARAGDVVLGLREDGFRSNGISAVRRAFQKQFGGEWAEAEEAQPYIQMAAVPSMCYQRLITDLNGWHSNLIPKVHLSYVAHLSGGGLVSKFGKDFLKPFGLSAILNEMPEPPKIMKLCKEWGDLSDEDAHKTWNGGIGKVIVCRPGDCYTIIQTARQYGMNCQKIGSTVEPKDGTPTLTIHSAFSGEVITPPLD